MDYLQEEGGTEGDIEQEMPETNGLEASHVDQEADNLLPGDMEEDDMGMEDTEESEHLHTSHSPEDDPSHNPDEPFPMAPEDQALFSPDEMSALTMPNPTNLTAAVSAVVKSQPIFGDYLDTSDSCSLYSNINPKKNALTYGGLRRARGRRKYNTVKKFSLRNIAGRFASTSVNNEVSRESDSTGAPASPPPDVPSTSPPAIQVEDCSHPPESPDRDSPELTPSPLLSQISPHKPSPEPGEIDHLGSHTPDMEGDEEADSRLNSIGPLRPKCSSASTS